MFHISLSQSVTYMELLEAGVGIGPTRKGLAGFLRINKWSFSRTSPCLSKIASKVSHAALAGGQEGCTGCHRRVATTVDSTYRRTLRQELIRSFAGK